MEGGADGNADSSVIRSRAVFAAITLAEITLAGNAVAAASPPGRRGRGSRSIYSILTLRRGDFSVRLFDGVIDYLPGGAGFFTDGNGQPKILRNNLQILVFRMVLRQAQDEGAGFSTRSWRACRTTFLGSY